MEEQKEKGKVPRIGTHWEDCYLVHHDCAIDLLEATRLKLESAERDFAAMHESREAWAEGCLKAERELADIMADGESHCCRDGKVRPWPTVVCSNCGPAERALWNEKLALAERERDEARGASETNLAAVARFDQDRWRAERALAASQAENAARRAAGIALVAHEVLANPVHKHCAPGCCVLCDFAAALSSPHGDAALREIVTRALDRAARKFHAAKKPEGMAGDHKSISPSTAAKWLGAWTPDILAEVLGPPSTKEGDATT